MKKIILLILLPSLILVQPSFSQTTYDRVYNIFQTRCASSCHNYGSPDGNMRLDGTKQDVLNNLVNVTPDNANAIAKGYKRVYPGDARKSFLFEKINQGLDANVSLHNGEGAPMPKDSVVLPEVEREMIRQWIIFGASDTGYSMVRESVISDYYNGKAEHRDPSLPVPAASEGAQIYFGPIFLQPGEEVEYDSKFSLFNNADVEVYRMASAVNKESHHMALFKYHPGEDASTPPGLKRVRNIGDAAALFYSTDVVGQWPNSLDIETPAGTALIWDSNTVLNISYHVLNYSDSIIACELYFNFYTRPPQPGTKPMLSYPVRYDGKPVYEGGWEVGNLIVPPNAPGDSTKLTMVQYSPDSSFYWDLWSIQAHTHKLGKGYNVWLRNPDGTKGELIYNGRYDETYTFDRGFYDWEHPPLRRFEPQQPVDMTVGLIHEADFVNSTPDTVGFGLKTTDEMYVTYIFYTKSETPLGILPDKVFNDSHVKIYPNPVQQEAFIHIGPDVILKNAELRIYDLMGKEAMVVQGFTDNKFTINTASLQNGNYFYRLINDGKATASGKISVVR